MSISILHFEFVFLFYFEGPKGPTRFLSASPRQHFSSLRLSILGQGKPCIHVIFETYRQKICIWDIQTAQTQTELPATCSYMSRVIRKPAFYICENKDRDQLRGNRKADQCLCFCYIDRTIPLLSESEISSL